MCEYVCMCLLFWASETSRVFGDSHLEMDRCKGLVIDINVGFWENWELVSVGFGLDYLGICKHNSTI